MPRSKTVTEAQIKRTIKAALDCGLFVKGFQIRDHEVRVMCEPAGKDTVDVISSKQSNIEPLPWPDDIECTSCAWQK